MPVKISLGILAVNKIHLLVLFGSVFVGRFQQVVFGLTFADLEGRNDVAGRFDCVE